MIEKELALGRGRTVHVYDTGERDRLAVVWHHGTPNVGAPPEPLFAAADRLGIRWVSYDRPGYGGSTPDPGRTVASAAALTAHVADALGIDRFATFGHSGGGPHALACAALLPERVVAACGVAGLSPYDGDDAWFAGMSDAGAASLRAAVAGREAKERHEAAANEDDPGFVRADWRALRTEWSWFLQVAEAGMANGPGGLIDDDLAYVAPWGFEPADVRAPVLLVHGTADRVVPVSHAERLASACPAAELRVVPDAGHISVLAEAESALEWLRSTA